MSETAVSNYATCAGYEIHYLEWGRPELPPVIAWHGLARVGRDFDTLARHLSARFRVIAPDTIGRGLSQWADDADSDYCFAIYSSVVADLCDQLGIGTLRWIGTSMGGSLGIWVAGGLLKDRVTHLVINDIGPELPQAAMDRISTYLGAPPVMDTVGELETYLREIYAPFGFISDSEWRAMTEASFRRLENGRVTSHYDPRIAHHFTSHPDDWRLWDRYDVITAKCLLLRGDTSDLLSSAMAEDMTRRGPHAQLVICSGCGHAPALNAPEQMDLIAGFLSS